MQKASDFFYSDLVSHKMPLPKLLGETRLFLRIPDDWTVVITDIKNSTDAVFSGQHQTVNLLATGSIVTVLNLAFKLKVAIPFFFGGDGATFLVPPILKEQALANLQVFKQNALQNFNLDLRVGHVPVSRIFGENHDLSIAKYYNSSIFSIPIILGDGLIFAEKVIKGRDYPIEDFASENSSLDLSGMQCRWDRIAVPEDKEEIVTLLVLATDMSRQAEVFKAVLSEIDAVFGNQQKRQPISVEKLRLQTTFGRLGTEMRARIGSIKMLELLREKLISFYAYIYLRTMKGKRYLEKLVDRSDTLVLDGKINTVISGSRNQREKLVGFLEKLESDQKILYGIHISNASIMSCYVRDLDDDHIHFIDGSDGGYTQAARMLKAKMAG